MSFQHTLYVIRHGETDWNREGRFQGSRDIPLNAKGHRQAARNAEALKAKLAGHRTTGDTPGFITSPLSRAKETATIVARTLAIDSARMHQDDRVQEMRFGTWEGRTAEELKTHAPHQLKERHRDPWHFRAEGGESYADLAGRLSFWLEGVERDTILVTHGGVCRVLRVLLLDDPIEELMRGPVPQDKVMILKSGSAEWI